MTVWPRRALLLDEEIEEGGDFGRPFASALSASGCDVDHRFRDEDFSADYDLVLGYGPFRLNGSLRPAARRVLSMPETRRPVFAWWLTEGVPSRWMPLSVARLGGRLRLALDDMAPKAHSPDRWGPAADIGWLRRGHRLRVLGELHWACRAGAIDVLAVTSASRAAYLQRQGLSPVTVPLGYDPEDYGADLGMTERDIPVCFIGSLGTGASRRRRLLARVVRALKARGIDVVVQNDISGRQRTEFLNRTRIMLNIMRAPQDFVGQRFLLAAANKTLAVSEMMHDSLPFVPGRHVVMVPLEQIAETVAYFLAHEEERRALVEEAHRFVTEQLTVGQMMGRIVEAARAVATRRSALPGAG